MGPSAVRMRCPDVDCGNALGARRRSRSLIHGMNTNWMNAKGSTTRRNAEPDTSTSTENDRPRSEVNVMSPNPSVVMIVIVQ